MQGRSISLTEGDDIMIDSTRADFIIIILQMRFWDTEVKWLAQSLSSYMAELEGNQGLFFFSSKRLYFFSKQWTQNFIQSRFLRFLPIRFKETILHSDNWQLFFIVTKSFGTKNLKANNPTAYEPSQGSSTGTNELGIVFILLFKNTLHWQFVLCSSSLKSSLFHSYPGPASPCLRHSTQLSH